MWMYLLIFIFAALFGFVYGKKAAFEAVKQYLTAKRHADRPSKQALRMCENVQ